MTNNTELATLGGGCFWCLEAVYQQLKGVQQVVSGYAGGHVFSPTYQAVCSGSTGHAEVVQLTYDPTVVSFKDILDVFFTIHDPTTLNRQGNDIGTQYRSAIYTHSPEQQQVAEQAIAEAGANWGQSHRHRSHGAGYILPGGGLSSELLHQQPAPGLLPVHRRPQGRQVPQAAP